MKLAIYDPPPLLNDFVSLRYLSPLLQYCHQSGITVKRISDPIPEAGWTMMCHTGHLNETIVHHFDACGCPLVGISCNDSAYLTANIDKFFWKIPLVFTISGVQRVNYSNRSIMNPDMTVTTEPVQYLPDDMWEKWEMMRTSGRLLPLPYVPWDRLPDVHISEQKTPKILFRGGCHFWRFVAYLHALKAGVAHPASGFLLRDYFAEDMVPQFRFCEKCRADYREGGNRMPFMSGVEMCDCVKELMVDDPLRWNNRSPRAFFMLAREFSERIGRVEYCDVEQALNFQRQSADHHLRAIADAAFFCDMKWEFSIHGAQRMYEAMSVGTINLLPRRAMDQDYFPAMEDGNEYITFADDFSDGFDILKNDHWRNLGGEDRIRQRGKALYEQWIKPSEYVTNTNLLKLILQEIEDKAT